MKTIITTVGTSLLTGRKPWSWNLGKPLPPEDIVDKYLSTADLAEASAETNTWSKLGLLEEPERHRLMLLHTPTPDGKFCAERLQKFAKARNMVAEMDNIVGLDPGSRGGFEHGLTQLSRQIASQVQRSTQRGGDVAIAATGGFKAETAIANLVGVLLGVPVHYIHETFREIVTIPPLPVGLDLAFLRTDIAGRLMAELGGDQLIRRDTIGSYLKSDPRLEFLLETIEIDGELWVGLNAMGAIALELLKAPASDWPPPSEKEPERKLQMSGVEHHRPADWQHIVQAIAQSRYVESIRYAPACGTRNRIELSENDAGALIANLSDGKTCMGLAIRTTAQNED
jgi:putative CRISPR-associated protein (TIGR02619 family)